MIDIAPPDPIDCQWSSWSSCSKTCGYGTRTRFIAQESKYGGVDCQGNNMEKCHDQNCPGSNNYSLKTKIKSPNKLNKLNCQSKNWAT